jgi:hypothetical protein
MFIIVTRRASHAKAQRCKDRKESQKADGLNLIGRIVLPTARLNRLAVKREPGSAKCRNRVRLY